MTREGFIKHRELIEAWANGAEVQYLADGEWCDCYKNLPNWKEDTEYRIKPREPKKKTIVLETWLILSQDGGYCTIEGDNKYFIVFDEDRLIKRLSTREVEIDA